MDEAIGRQLVRQLKIINFWITFFGAIFIISLIVSGVLLYKTYVYVNHAAQQISTLQKQASDDLNLQKQICSTPALRSLVGEAGKYCTK